MTRNGVLFEEKNVEDDAEAFQAVRDLGYQQVPVIVAPDGSHWSGLRPDLLSTL